MERMGQLGPDNAVWIGDGDWIAFEDFGDIDPDEPMDALLPVLEWQDRLCRRFPDAELPVIRQFIRLSRAAAEYRDTTGRHLNIYGALGELYGAMVWGVRLHRKPDTSGSDGRLGRDWVEIKTIGPKSSTDRVQVKLSGNFNKLLVVKIIEGGTRFPGDFHVTSRLVCRRDLTSASRGNAGLAWSRACRVGLSPPSRP